MEYFSAQEVIQALLQYDVGLFKKKSETVEHGRNCKFESYAFTFRQVEGWLNVRIRLGDGGIESVHMDCNLESPVGQDSHPELYRLAGHILGNAGQGGGQQGERQQGGGQQGEGQGERQQGKVQEKTELQASGVRWETGWAEEDQRVPLAGVGEKAAEKKTPKVFEVIGVIIGLIIMGYTFFGTEDGGSSDPSSTGAKYGYDIGLPAKKEEPRCTYVYPVGLSQNLSEWPVYISGSEIVSDGWEGALEGGYFNFTLRNESDVDINMAEIHWIVFDENGFVLTDSWGNRERSGTVEANLPAGSGASKGFNAEIGHDDFIGIRYYACIAYSVTDFNGTVYYNECYQTWADAFAGGKIN